MDEIRTKKMGKEERKRREERIEKGESWGGREKRWSLCLGKGCLGRIECERGGDW